MGRRTNERSGVVCRLGGRSSACNPALTQGAEERFLFRNGSVMCSGLEGGRLMGDNPATSPVLERTQLGRDHGHAI